MSQVLDLLVVTDIRHVKHSSGQDQSETELLKRYKHGRGDRAIRLAYIKAKHISIFL